MGDDEPAVDWEGVIREMITRATETASTEPGVYKMPCGECVVDFFITAEGEEHWLVAGDERSYTRETVAITRHGDHPWERLYTLADAARELARLAAANGGDIDRVLVELVEAIDDREVARVVRERDGMSAGPLEDVAARFGVDLDDL